MFGNNLQSHYPPRYMECGDRIFVRISRQGQTLMEFVVDNASSYTDLIGEIRYAAQHIEGLTNIFIRNYSRGWSRQCPMRFYPGVSRPQRNAPSGQPVRRMLCPWETH